MRRGTSRTLVGSARWNGHATTELRPQGAEGSGLPARHRRRDVDIMAEVAGAVVDDGGQPRLQHVEQSQVVADEADRDPALPVAVSVLTAEALGAEGVGVGAKAGREPGHRSVA